MLEETLQLLKNRPVGLTFDKISEGTDLSVPWLKLLLKGTLNNPSYYRVEILNRFLKGYNVQ